MARSHQFFQENPRTTSNSATFRRQAKVRPHVTVEEFKKKIEHMKNLFEKMQALAAHSKKKTSIQPPSRSDQILTIMPEMNQLAYKLDDVNSMISCVPLASQNTLDILNRLFEIANDAADGMHSDDELKNMNYVFQRLKQYIAYAQMVNLIAGQKSLGGGDVVITLGEDDIITIPFKPIDIYSLGIDEANVLDPMSAVEAIDSLYLAAGTLVENIYVSQLRVEEARSLLMTVPYILDEVMTLYTNIRELAMLAATGTTSDAERVWINQVFKSLLKEVNKLHTLATEDGVRYFGNGRLEVQIGQVASDQTTLNLQLPVTDVYALGLDKHDLLTQDKAVKTIYALNEILYGIVYNNDKEVPALRNEEYREVLSDEQATDDEYYLSQEGSDNESSSRNSPRLR